MNSFTPKPTQAENKLFKLLRKLKISVKQQVFDGYKHIDLSIDSAKLDIEVDGIQHLTDSERIISDFKRSDYSRDAGYETLHVHNVDLEKDAPAIASAIAEVAKKREEDIDIMEGVRQENPEAKIMV